MLGGANHDPYWAQTILYLKMDGTNNSTTFTDSSPQALTVSVAGDTKISTAQSKFGGSSAYFDGNGDNLNISSATLFDFSGDFTVEGWFYFSQVNQYNGATVFVAMDVLNAFQFATEGDNIRLRYNGSLLIDYSHTASTLLNTWTHLAITRSGSTISLWKNFQKLVSATSSAVINVSTLYIGQQVNNATAFHYFNGYVDDFRITYASRYSDPPILPASAFSTNSNGDPYWASTSLLMHFDGANNSTTFTDSSINALSVTAYGNAVISTTQSKFGGASGAFDGTGDYITLTIPSAIGTGDFTIEGWFYSTASLDNYRCVIDGRNGGGNGHALYVGGVSNDNNVNKAVIVYNTTIVGSGGSLSTNTWTHLALVRSGSSLKLYINGVSTVSLTDTNNITGTGFKVGASTTGQEFSGYLDDLRITKGVARYPSNFTVPASAYPNGYHPDPNFSNVALQLSFDGTNASTTIVDSGPKSLLNTNTGSVSLSSTKSKFGGTSGKFSGSNYLTFTNSQLFDFSASDWTIEFWFNLDSVPSSSYDFIGASNGGGNVPKWGFTMNMGTNYLYSANRFGFFTYNGGNRWINVAYTWSANTWYHAMVMQKGDSIYLYLNGVFMGAMQYKIAASITGNLIVGSDGELYKYFTGYMDDLRITRSAIYTNATQVNAHPTGYNWNSNFSSVSLLMHMDGTNNSTTFRDNSLYASSVSVVGSSVISTAQSKFGGASGYFGGGANYVTLPNSSIFDFGSGDFTIEFWLYFTGTGTQFQLFSRAANQSGSLSPIFIERKSNNTIGLSWTADGSSWVLDAAGGSTTLAASSWHHIAVTRESGAFKIFVNGALDYANYSNSSAIQNGGDIVSIGRWPKYTNNNGPYYLDEFRITKGVAIYTSAFTPQPLAFPNYFTWYTTTPVNGPALWFDGMDSNSFYTDAGTTTVVANGNSVYQWSDKSGNARNATQATSGSRPTWTSPANARNNIGATSFNGSNHMDLASYTLSVGTGNFTIEGWIKPNSYTGNNILLSTGTNGVIVYFNSSGKMLLGKYGVSTTFTSTATISTSSWTHFAICRSGTTTKLFLNGTQDTSVTDTTNYTGSAALRIGYDAVTPTGNYAFNGSLQNLIIYDNKALYTSSFVPWLS